MKNKVLKSIAILLIIAMITMICNISMATGFTSSDLKNSLIKCHKKQIFIKGSDNSKTTLGGNSDDAEMIITDSKIGGKADGVEYTFFNYSVVDNVCTFDADIDSLYKLLKVDPTKAKKEILAMNTPMLGLLIYMSMENLYVSAADFAQKDLSTAYTYFMQKMEEFTAKMTESEKIDINISNEFYSLVIKSNDKNVLETASLKIYLDKFAKLSELNINKNKTTYKVFVGQIPDSEREDISLENKIEKIANQVYKGSEIKPAIKIVDKKYGFESYLLEGSDYVVIYNDNVKMGKATVTITGINYNKGVITQNFYIVPVKVKGVKNKTQSKTSITVKWDKIADVTGYEVDIYNKSKKKYVKVKDVKTNSCEVTGLNVATTYKFRVRAYKTVDGKKYYGAYSSAKKLTTKTKTPSVSKLIAGKKKLTVNFGKTSGADGYEIQYSTNKKFKKDYKTVSTKSTKKTISKLKGKKKYYVRIRTYRVVDGEKVYSSYSDAKSIKTK